MDIKPPIDWKEVKGIFVRGCVDRGEGSSFRAKAHSHNYKNRPLNCGWICVRAFKRLGEVVTNNDGTQELVKPSRLLWHEYAHILTPNHHHDDTWRNKMKELHQPLIKQYDKKRRCRWVFLKERETTYGVKYLQKFYRCKDCGKHSFTQKSLE